MTAAADRLIELANTAGPVATRKRDTDRIHLYATATGISGDCRVSGDSVTFDDLSVPYEVAEQIVRLLARASAERVAS